MTDLPESLFANPVWSALHSVHRRFAVSSGEASRYPADVSPFAAVATPSTAALEQLASLLVPEESVWVVAESLPETLALRFKTKLECLQMVLPEDLKLPELSADIVPLSNSDAPAMVALTDVAFPGFFRTRTCEMGSYYGIRSGGELIAMGGERLMLDGYPEVSGICTHPAHRGKGYAEALLAACSRTQRTCHQALQQDGLHRISQDHVASPVAQSGIRQ